ncbi:ADP-ribosylglycohydrolase family protein [Streptosporangium sp. NBC_01639]|uniref:ADP-ribosylglycohydrolase family protein n=1 Tax=unclassified Streptosporangium TaxID=2632669 RepID=UPI002DDA91C5|nr:ADP-ribosylglycohydrolase family protein [Streptosporangium sp. NBC_01756]WSC87292.1 ADP-ribosylglycohydrolase family protein [Streptosporangium sp. NBC_01756]WTD54019.1 ADP-ribosylglycohydrolase family protein [Streptosporangium sp. NBC_01639]
MSTAGETGTPVSTAEGTLEDRAVGCVAGAAVGDALGGATEGWTPEQIHERYGGYVEGLVPPYFEDWRNARPIAPYHKGDGHITDDTLMTHALIRVYERVGGHLDAYAAAEHLVPEMMGEKRWIPELETEALPLQRVFLAEKWLVLRLHYGHVDPREAGVGNIVNCGAAMYMAPVGVVNAADPEAAYAEAIELAGAHQSSYGREAAGVLAAAVAEAMRPGATPDSVVAACLRVARDGTKAAIDAVCSAARGLGHWDGSFETLRAAMKPYDTVADTYRDQGLGARRPSRLHSIEELPLALAFLLIAKGDYRDTVLGGVNYGRDADSIASMGGAVAGALGGRGAVPADWLEPISTASRTDLVTPGLNLARVARDIHRADLERRRAHESAFAALLGDAG